MKSVRSFLRSALVAGSSLVLVVAFQNCSPAQYDSASDLSQALKAADQDASFVVDQPSSEPAVSTPPASSPPSMPTSAPPKSGTTVINTGTNTQSSTVISTGTGAPCPNGVATGPNVSINISNGNNQQSNSFSSKAMIQQSSCQDLKISDLKVALSQIIARSASGEVALADVKGQFLSVESSISFQALASASDVESISFILQASGHQYMNSSAQVKVMSLRDSGKKAFTVKLAQRTSFEKGQTYKLRLHISEASALTEDAGKCLLRPVVEVE